MLGYIPRNFLGNYITSTVEAEINVKEEFDEKTLLNPSTASISQETMKLATNVSESSYITATKLEANPLT